jgi:hypothetical protein
MEESWYSVQQQVRDRITEARAAARGQALQRETALLHRGRYAVGLALIRLGAWILTGGVGSRP